MRIFSVQIHHTFLRVGSLSLRAEQLTKRLEEEEGQVFSDAELLLGLTGWADRPTRLRNVAPTVRWCEPSYTCNLMAS